MSELMLLFRIFIANKIDLINVEKFGKNSMNKNSFLT